MSFWGNVGRHLQYAHEPAPEQGILLPVSTPTAPQQATPIKISTNAILTSDTASPVSVIEEIASDLSPLCQPNATFALNGLFELADDAPLNSNGESTCAITPKALTLKNGEPAQKCAITQTARESAPKNGKPVPKCAPSESTNGLGVLECAIMLECALTPAAQKVQDTTTAPVSYTTPKIGERTLTLLEDDDIELDQNSLPALTFEGTSLPLVCTAMTTKLVSLVLPDNPESSLQFDALKSLIQSVISDMSQSSDALNLLLHFEQLIKVPESLLQFEDDFSLVYLLRIALMGEFIKTPVRELAHFKTLCALNA